MLNLMLPYHYEQRVLVSATPSEVFNFIDDPILFSSHMAKSSWMMGGGKMTTSVDDGKGKKVGSHITMTGTALGFSLWLDEVVTQYQPPNIKVWETADNPKLLVVGPYKMVVQITPQEEKSLLNVSIDYALPAQNAWLGLLFGGFYAKWCVSQMTGGVAHHFLTIS